MINNNLARMRTEHERGVAWDRDGLECEHAAWRGDIECLRYAHEHGAPWDAYGTTCQRAAMRGHIDCMRYAHEHGASYSGDACALAMMGGHAACVRYALCTGAAMPSLLDQVWSGMDMSVRHIPRALRNAVRALIAAWRSRCERRLAAVAKLEGAWLEYCYRPGGPGAARSCSRAMRSAADHARTGAMVPA